MEVLVHFSFQSLMWRWREGGIFLLLFSPHLREGERERERESSEKLKLGEKGKSGGKCHFYWDGETVKPKRIKVMKFWRSPWRMRTKCGIKNTEFWVFEIKRELWFLEGNKWQRESDCGKRKTRVFPSLVWLLVYTTSIFIASSFV